MCRAKRARLAGVSGCQKQASFACASGGKSSLSPCVNAERLTHCLVQISERASLEKQLQEMQAQLTVLVTTTIASKVGTGTELPESSPAVVEGPGPVVAPTGPSTGGTAEAAAVAATAAAAAATVTAATSDNPACETAAAQSEVSLG